MRSRFTSLGRCEATLFDMRRRGDDREILLHVLLSGKGQSEASCARRAGSCASSSRPPLGRAGSPAWRIRSGSVASWLSASAGAPLYDDVSERAGLTRRHVAFLPNAAKNIPIPGEHMPPGAAVLDFDGDGRQDVFVPGGDGNRLYRNKGDGTFEDVAEKAGVAGQEGEAIGAVAFDYDNDGRTDLYVTYLLRPNRLYRNRGDGTFEETAEKAGVALDEYCTSAAALDYDRDGLPDLYVLVYGHPGERPDARGRQRAAQPPLPQQRRRHVHRRLEEDAHRRHAAGASPSRARTSTATAGRTSTWRTTSARTRTCTTAETAPSRTRRREPACSTRASAWASRWTTWTATAGPTSTSRTTRSR